MTTAVQNIILRPALELAGPRQDNNTKTEYKGRTSQQTCYGEFVNNKSSRLSRFLLMLPMLSLFFWCSDSDAQIQRWGHKEGKVLPQYFWDPNYRDSGQGYFVIGMNYYLGNSVKRDRYKAIENFNISADRGNADAQYTLGFIHLNGELVRQSDDKALEYWTLAARNNHLRSQMLLAELYSDGSLADKDFEKAAYWYKRASDAGDAEAKYELGLMYQQGLGVEQDSSRAARLWKSAAKNGHVESQAELAYLYYAGEGVTQDIVKAIKGWHDAASKGSASAQYNLGFAYEKGYGLVQNLYEAFVWYRVAEIGGVSEAAADCKLIRGRLTEKQYKDATKRAKFVHSLIRGKIFNEDITSELVNTNIPDWQDILLKDR